MSQALRVGVEAPMLLSSAFLGATQGWNAVRKVLNISSGLGRRAMASSATYCAAKAGMDHFTRCMALEEALLPNGARVCSLAPGVIDTDMQDQLRHADALLFPDRAMFEGMHVNGQLSSPAVSDQPCHIDSCPLSRKHSVHITRKWTLWRRREWRGAITALNLERKFLLHVGSPAHRLLRLRCVTG
jgi:hypothetical protein